MNTSVLTCDVRQAGWLLKAGALLELSKPKIALLELLTVAVAACIAMCSAELQAQCVGCGGSTPIYSTPMSTGTIYAPMYGTQTYGTPIYNQATYSSYTPVSGCCGQITSTAMTAPIATSIPTSGCYFLIIALMRKPVRFHLKRISKRIFGLPRLPHAPSLR